MKKTIRIGMIGATGYVGHEMLRTLVMHPAVKITQLASRSYKGKLYSEIYPQFRKVLDLVLVDPEEACWAERCDLVITALPHGISQVTVPKLLAEGVKVLDHSGDFRFRDAATYEAAYKLEAKHPELLSEAIYGIPEIYREAIKDARLIANPGCYPTATILGLAPLLAAGATAKAPSVINALSGISGAGRQSTLAYSYCETAESARPYAAVGHRHIAEIEQELSRLSGEKERIIFSPHLVPMKRGMLVTAVLQPKEEGWTQAKLTALYKTYYEQERFVRVMDEGEMVDTSFVSGSNFVDIAAVWDQANMVFKIFTAIDNLGKGAAMQAIQSMNVLFSLPEETGLNHPASFL